MVIYKNKNGRNVYILGCIDLGTTAVYVCDSSGQVCGVETTFDSLREARAYVEKKERKEALVMEMR